jgi:hypothetical protein
MPQTIGHMWRSSQPCRYLHHNYINFGNMYIHGMALSIYLSEWACVVLDSDSVLRRLPQLYAI